MMLLVLFLDQSQFCDHKFNRNSYFLSVFPKNFPPNIYIEEKIVVFYFIVWILFRLSAWVGLTPILTAYKNHAILTAKWHTYVVAIFLFPPISKSQLENKREWLT